MYEIMFDCLPEHLVNSAKARGAIAAAIINKRNELGITQKDLAHDSGMSLKDIVRLESADKEITLTDFMIIMGLLKIPFDIIINERSAMNRKKEPCRYCLNARSDPKDELYDDNDGSSLSIGSNDVTFHGFLNSGDHRPVNIEVMHWNPRTERNETVFWYFPKFCPECGRDLRDDYGS